MSTGRAPFHIESLPFRICLFFAINPHEALTTGDIAIKWDVDQNKVSNRLASAVRQGIIAREAGGRGRNGMATYIAGPRLLEIVGGATQRAMIAACVPLACGRGLGVSSRDDGDRGLFVVEI
jgi:hypothetical protein